MSGNAEIEEFCALVRSILETKTGCLSFRSLQNDIRQLLGRNLNRDEQNLLTKILLEKSTFLEIPPSTPSHPRSQFTPHLDNGHGPVGILPHEILICMAYSKDYTIGNICEVINSQYATHHGYQFYCEKIEYEKMMTMIEPRKHCAWYKVLLIRNLLKSEGKNSFSSEIQDPPLPTNWRYLVWIDADAIVINFHQSIEHILHNHFIPFSPSFPSSSPSPSIISQSIFSDLIISQDFSSSSSCPLNTGVMIIQKTPWSQSLWEDVWSHPSCEKYHHVYFYDQSALVKCLKLRNVHLPSCCFEEEDEAMTALTSPYRKKIPRVQILPCALLNSNRISPQKLGAYQKQDHTGTLTASPGVSSIPTLSIQQLISASVEENDKLGDQERELLEYGLGDVDRELTEGIQQMISSSSSSSSSLLNDGANFIFHAVGGWNKMKALLRVCQLSRLITLPEIHCYCRSNGIDFRLHRGKCGGVPLLKDQR
jgi:hypothetical protein